MNKTIAKICKNCGPLTNDQIFIRKKSIDCKNCIRNAIKRSHLKNKKKIKEAREKREFTKRPVSITELTCKKCGITKSVLDFQRYMLNIKYPYCRICRNEMTKKHHDKKESKLKHKKWFQEKYEPTARSAQYMKKYGITLDQFEKMSEQQDHLCLICKKPETHTRRKDGKCFLHVDHCHLTGKVRGLLCLNCNVGLGKFSDSREMLLMAAAYLESYSS